MSDQTAPYTEGAIVRVTQRSTSGVRDLDEQAARSAPCRLYTVFSFVDADESRRIGEDPKGLPYYLLDSEGSFGGDAWAYPEHLELVIADESARELPTEADVATHIGQTAHADREIEVDETDWSAGDGTVELVGRTAEGLRFAAVVRVASVRRVDA